MNLQPSEAETGFDIRVPPTADIESLEKRIAEEWAPASRNMTFEVETLKHLSLGKTNPYWAIISVSVKLNGILPPPPL